MIYLHILIAVTFKVQGDVLVKKRAGDGDVHLIQKKRILKQKTTCMPTTNYFQTNRQWNRQSLATDILERGQNFAGSQRGVDEPCHPIAHISDTSCQVTTKFRMIRGLANGHFFSKFAELWFWGPVMPCSDMHQSVTDALVLLLCTMQIILVFSINNYQNNKYFLQLKWLRLTLQFLLHSVLGCSTFLYTGDFTR